MHRASRRRGHGADAGLCMRLPDVDDLGTPSARRSRPAAVSDIALVGVTR